jgi:hypothetical protein
MPLFGICCFFHLLYNAASKLYDRPIGVLSRMHIVERLLGRRSEPDVDDNGSSNTPLERSIGEVVNLHPGEWVLIRVTRHDGDSMPAKGYVIAHSPRRDDVSEALPKGPAEPELPQGTPPQPYYIFHAFSPDLTDEDDDGALAGLVDLFSVEMEDEPRASKRG